MLLLWVVFSATVGQSNYFPAGPDILDTCIHVKPISIPYKLTHKSCLDRNQLDTLSQIVTPR